MVSNYLNKNGNFYIQDTENINNSYPIFATCKPYATTLEVVAVDSTHATIKGAYKYLTSAQAVGFEYKLVGERDFTSVTFPNVDTIYTGAFQSCSSLTSIDFPNATKIYGYN